MPSDVLARTCFVSTRDEDSKKGFQRLLDRDRARSIADYVDKGFGSIPNSIVLSAQSEAHLRVIGRGKTLEFRDTPRAFLVIDGQHRVYGFSLAKTSLRVPVVIYNALSRADECRLFIDINTKQRPVPNELLLDIKKLAETENEIEQGMREVYDLFNGRNDSPLVGLLSPSQQAKGKISRVTFNTALSPINAINGRISDSLTNWIMAARYQIYREPGEAEFELQFSNEYSPLICFAADSDRMASASVESITSIVPIGRLPKSEAWKIIKLYYAAFFAAHSILRMLGMSVSHLDKLQVDKINAVSTVYGHRRPVETGTYQCAIKGTSLRCERLTGSGGEHDKLWRVFYRTLESIVDRRLRMSNDPALQPIAAVLIRLQEYLRSEGCNSGTWLSSIRNRLNYRLEFGAWFPYSSQASEINARTRAILRAERLEYGLDLFPCNGTIERFVVTCAFIVRLSREMVQDMADRCPVGRSFHQFGSLRLTHQLNRLA
jgi:DGQHR domain-containing protein